MRNLSPSLGVLIALTVMLSGAVGYVAGGGDFRAEAYLPKTCLEIAGKFGADPNSVELRELSDFAECVVNELQRRVSAERKNAIPIPRWGSQGGE